MERNLQTVFREEEGGVFRWSTNSREKGKLILKRIIKAYLFPIYLVINA